MVWSETWLVDQLHAIDACVADCSMTQEKESLPNTSRKYIHATGEHFNVAVLGIEADEQSNAVNDRSVT